MTDSGSAGMSEPPRTEAGQLLLEEVGHQFKPLAAERIRRIEEQAATEARRELLAKVEGLRDGIGNIVRDESGAYDPAVRMRNAVTRLIEADK